MPIGDPNLIAGVGTLTLGGTLLAVRSDMVISPDPVKREGLAGQDRVHGYKETPRVPYIEANLSLQARQMVSDLLKSVGQTLVAVLADGRSFALKDCWYVGETEVSTQEGQFKAKFEGMVCTELT